MVGVKLAELYDAAFHLAKTILRPVLPVIVRGVDQPHDDLFSNLRVVGMGGDEEAEFFEAAFHLGEVARGPVIVRGVDQPHGEIFSNLWVVSIGFTNNPIAFEPFCHIQFIQVVKWHTAEVSCK